MTNETQEIAGVEPDTVLAILKDQAAQFSFHAGQGDDAQHVDCRLVEAGAGGVRYEYTQLFPGRLLKTVEVTIQVGATGGGTGAALGGRLLRMEAPPGTPIDGDADVTFEVETFWTYLKNLVVQAVNSGRIEQVERTYNAGWRELFRMIRDPWLLVPASFITVEKDESAGAVAFQDPTGSLVFLLRRTAVEEPCKVVYHLESNTSNMWVRTGEVELVVEEIAPARSRLCVRAAAGPTQIAEQMQMSAMYLPAEQLAGYLSFRQDLAMLMGWIDAAVPLQIPHIRDLITVQGDFVAGGKVEIKDSVLNRTEIHTGAGQDDGRYVVHADRQTGDKIQITDSVVSGAAVGGRARNVEVYAASLKAALADGRLDDSEAALLETLQSSLGITPAEHLTALEALGVLAADGVQQYARVLEATLADGKIDGSEAAILDTLRRQYGIPLIVHQALLTRQGRAG